MKTLLLLAILAAFSISNSFIARAETADDLYSRSKHVPTESLNNYLSHIENEISLISIHQGTSVSFDGDQGDGYWQRQKNSPRFFILMRFKDGTRSFIWIERTPTEVSDKLYSSSTPLEIHEDGRTKVLAEMKSLTLVKELLGSREVRVHQLTLIAPMTVYSVSH